MTTQPLSILPNTVRDTLATIDEYFTAMQADLPVTEIGNEGVSGDILAYINNTRKCVDRCTTDPHILNLIKARGKLRNP